MVMTEQQLKRLGGVEHGAEKVQDVAAKTYQAVRSRTPEPVQRRLDAAEEKIATTAAPYVAKAQDVGSNILRTADAKLDEAITRTQERVQANTEFIQSQIERQKQHHQQNLEAYRTARDTYLRKVEAAVDYLRTHGLTGTAKAAADAVIEQVGRAREVPGMLLSGVEAAMDRLLALAPVQAITSRAAPIYNKLHDNVVSLPAYRQTYDLAQQVLERGQATWLWSRVAGPLVQPSLTAVAQSKYGAAAIEQLRPAAASA